MSTDGDIDDILSMDYDTNMEEVMNIFGDVPIPPYLERETHKDDEERY